MTTAVIFCRVVLVAVFATAAVAKLADRPATRRSVLAFGVPDGLADLATWLVIAAELATAVLLCGSATAQLGGILALALLVVFCVAAGVNLAKGRTPECNCFGQVRSEPIGRGLLVRNIVFAVLALVVAAGGASDAGPSLWAPTADGSGAAIAATIAIGVLAAAVVLLALRLRTASAVQADLAVRVQALEEARSTAGAGSPVGGGAPVYEAGLPVGSPAAAFTLPTTTGTMSLDDLLAPGRPVVMVFTSPTCSTCHSVLAKVTGWTESYGDVLSFAVMTSQSAEANAGVVQLLAGFEPVLFDADQIWDDYQARWTPAAVVVGIDGAITTDTAVGLKDIALMVMRAVAAARSAEATGAAAS